MFLELRRQVRNERSPSLIQLDILKENQNYSLTCLLNSSITYPQYLFLNYNDIKFKKIKIF